MEIKTAFQTDKGTVTFKGTLTQEEHDYVIQVGLNWLMQQNALPFTMVDTQEGLDD